MGKKLYEIRMITNCESKCSYRTALNMVKATVKIVLEKDPTLSWSNYIKDLHQAVAKGRYMNPKNAVVYTRLPKSIANAMHNRMFLNYGEFGSDQIHHENLYPKYVWFVEVKEYKHIQPRNVWGGVIND